jgi:dTDP-glucose 4,6-dehydratase
VGSLGTHNALGLAKARGARFLLASTSEVYGDPEVSPQTEDYWGRVNPVGPRGVYDEAKRFAEALTLAYYRTHRLDTRIARIFNTYGPRMRPYDGRVISNFIVQALQGKDLTIYGDGTQTRSFCYVSDLVEGITRLLLHNAENEEPSPGPSDAIHRPVNLGNPAEISIAETAALVIRLTKSSSRVAHHPLPVDDPKCRRPDISRARDLLSWEPHVSLEEGLGRTIDYFRRL